MSFINGLIWWRIQRRASNFGSKIDSTQVQSKSFNFSQKFTHLNSWVVTKRKVQPLMARDTLGYQYTGDEDTPRMPGDEVDNDDIIKRLGKIFESSIPVLPRRPRNVTRKRASKKLKIIETTSQEVGTVNCVVEYF
jgi:hypothetical protein